MNMRELLIRFADRWTGFTPNALLPRIEESQYWPTGRLEALQLERVKLLLRHAGANVPYYRDVFRSLDFNPDCVESIADIKVLPIVDKALIAAQPERFLSSNAEHPIRWLRTSGSTGQPFRFALTRLAQSYKIASRLRFRRWYGINRCDPQLIVGGIPPVSGNLRGKLRASVHQYITNRVSVYASDLHDGGLEAASRLMERHRVKSVMGYPSGITSLADYVAARGLNSRPPIAVFTNSETLFGWMRGRIRAGLKSEPRSDYVATEGSIAHECPEGGLHVDMEETIVELVPIEGEHEVCEVVVTFLHTFDFPLIRYRIGDIAMWAGKPCTCGRGLVALDALIGRYDDCVRMPDGRAFTAANINMRIAHFPFIGRVSQYQIVQRDSEHVELRVLEGRETDSQTVEEFGSSLGDLFHPLKVSVVSVSELPRERGGKFRVVVGLPRGIGEN